MKLVTLEKFKTLYFTVIFSISGISILFIQYLRKNSSSESWDKTLILVSIFTSLLFATFFFLDIETTKNHLILSSLSLILLSFGIYGIEHHDKINNVDINKIFWFGFGPQIFLLTVLVIPIIFEIYNWNSLSTIKKRTLQVLAFIVSVTVIFALWQGGSSLIEPDSPEYVVNELLAIPSGNIPYVDFIPQYGILFTIVLSPFSKLFNPEELVTLGLYLMNIATIIALILGVWILYKAINKKSISLAILLVIPFTSLTQFPGRESLSGSIYSSLTQIPVRIFPGMLIGLFFINYATGKMGSKHIRLIFILAGFNLWLNTDFGLAILVSLLALNLLINGLKELFINLIYLTIGFSIYPLIIISSGSNFQLAAFATFIRQFGAGFGAEPIQTPGPVLVILPLIIALFFASTTPLILERFKKYVIEPEYRRAVLTSSFFSCWSLIGFTYYLNRSYASGQMQILFLPLSVASASYFYYLFPKVESLPWRFKDFFKKSLWVKSSIKHQLPNLSLAILMALPLATIIAFPNPQLEINRLTNAPSENKWPLSRNQKAFSDIENQLSLINSNDKGDVMYFGSSGNYVDLKYNIKNATIFNSPYDLLMSPKMVDIQCNNLVRLKPKYLLVNDSGLAIAQAFPNSILCGTYIISQQYPQRLLLLND